MTTNRAQILISAIDQTRGALESVRRGLGGLADTARSVNGVLANLGAAVSVAGLAAMLKSAIDTGDALDEMSQRVGISVETLSVWQPAAQQSGVQGAAFEQGLRKLAATMVEAATGSQDAARGFAAVGVEFRNHDGTLRATDAVLLDLAERFKAMPDGAEKTALAIRLFGRSGADLIPFLNQGRDGIEELAAGMQALGVQMSGETAAQAGRFNDTLDQLGLATRSVGQQVIAAVLPALNDLAGGLAGSARQGGALRAVLDGIVQGLKVLALGAATAGHAFIALGEAIGAGMAAAVEALRGRGASARALLADLKDQLAARFDELASLRNRLFDPAAATAEVQAPRIQADPDLLQRLAAPKAPRDTTAAETALLKAQLEAEFTLLKDGLARQQVALAAAFEDRLVSVREYHARKTELEQREVDAEIARRQQELARQRQVAAAALSQDDRLRARAEVAKAEADLIVLNQRRAGIAQANARQAAQAERDLAEALAQAGEELRQITGQATAADRQAAVERGVRDLKARLLAEADAGGVSLIDRLIDVKAAQANLAALEAQWRQAAERLRQAQEAVQIQQQAGLLTEAQARQQILALQQQSAGEMARLLPAMQQVAQAIGPEAVTRVQGWANELARARLVAAAVADELGPLWNDLGRGFGAALNDMLAGAQTWRGALVGLFQQVSNAFLQHLVVQPFQQWVAMQARMLALRLGFLQQEQAAQAAAGAAAVAQKSAETTAVVSMDAAQAGAGAAASQAAIPIAGPALALAAMAAMVAAVMALLGRVRKFAAGGLVTGPGTSTSDSVPARLSAGEYVVRAAAVRTVGVSVLDAINGIAAGPRLRGGDLAFAVGGLVPEVQASAAPPPQAVRIVNAIDPGVTHDHLQTPAGERLIVNIIGRNARAIRAALQG